MSAPRTLTVVLALSAMATLSACANMFPNNNPPAQASYTVPQPAGVSPSTIQQVQARLQQEGDYNQAIDGIWGPATESGVRSYQQQHNLSATGQLDSMTMASLNLGGTSSTAAATQPMPTQPMPTQPMQPNAAPPPANASQPAAAPPP